MSTTITCPACGYSGHGFIHIETPGVHAPVVSCKDGLYIKRELSEIRFDEAVDDRLQCPACYKRFELPAGITVTYSPDRRLVASDDQSIA